VAEFLGADRFDGTSAEDEGRRGVRWSFDNEENFKDGAEMSVKYRIEPKLLSDLAISTGVLLNGEGHFDRDHLYDGTKIWLHTTEWILINWSAF